MPSGSSVKAGGAFVLIEADANPLTKGLQAAAGHLKRWGDSVSAIGKQFVLLGGAIVTPLLAAAKLSAEAGASIYDMSRRTGIGTGALQEFAYAAAQSGIDLGTFEIAIKRMQKSISGVKDEFEGTTGSLSEFGITAEQIKGLSPDKQFELIASKIADIADPTQRAAAAMRVFGKSGTSVLPMIERLSELQGRSRELGLIRSDTDIKNAKQLEDTFTDLKLVSASLGATLTNAIKPVIDQVALGFLRASIHARQFISIHPTLIANVFKIGAGILVAGTALYGFGKALGFASLGLKLLAPLVGAIFSPVVLVGGALAGIAGALLYLSSVGPTVFKYLGDAFSYVADEAKVAFHGIADALAAGDIILAAQILWNAMEIGWLQFRNFLDGLFDTMAEGYVRSWIEATSKVQEVWVRMQESFRRMTTALGDSLVKLNIQLALKGAQTELRSREKNPEAYNPDTNEAEKAKLRANVKEYQAQLKNVDQQSAQGQAGISDEAQKKLDAIQKEKEANLKALENLRGKGHDATEIAEREKKIAELKAEEAKLRATAEAERAKAPTLGAVPTAPIPGHLDIPGAGTARAFGGVFNPNAIFGLGGTGGTEREVREIKAQVAIIARKIWAAPGTGTVGSFWL